MAQMILDIPDDKIAQVLDGLALQNDYNPEGGQTKAQFGRSIIEKELIAAYIFMDEKMARDVYDASINESRANAVGITVL
jgi:hypothetical protein